VTGVGATGATASDGVLAAGVAAAGVMLAVPPHCFEGAASDWPERYVLCPEL